MHCTSNVQHIFSHMYSNRYKNIFCIRYSDLCFQESFEIQTIEEIVKLHYRSQNAWEPLTIWFQNQSLLLTKEHMP